MEESSYRADFDKRLERSLQMVRDELSFAMERTSAPNQVFEAFITRQSLSNERIEKQLGAYSEEVGWGERQ